MNFKNIFLHILSFFLVLSTVNAQSTTQWMNYTSFQNINDIHTTNKHTWIASDGGLCRWDKANGHQTFFNKTNSPLPSNSIYQVFEASDGSLWLTHQLGIGYLKDGNYISVLPDNTGNFAQDALGSFAEDETGKIYIAAGSQWHIYHQNQIIESHDYPFYNAGMPQISVANQGKKVIISLINWYAPSGLLIWENGEWQVTEEEAQNPDYGYLEGEEFLHNKHYAETAFFKSSTGNFWYQSYHTIYQSEDGKTWTATSLKDIANIDGINPIDIIETPEGHIYFLSAQYSEKTISIISNKNGRWDVVTMPQNMGEYSRYPQCFEYIGNNRFLIGTNKKNLWEWEIGNTSLTPTPIHASPLLWNNVTHVAHHQNSTFVANVDALYHIENDQWTNLLTLPNAPQQSRIFTLNSTGELYTPLNNHLYYWNGQQWSNSQMPTTDDDQVYLMTADQQDNIWLVKKYQLWRYDGTNWTNFTSNEHGLTAYRFKGLIPSRNGGIWIADRDGFARYHNGNWTAYTDGQEDSYINGLAETADGKLWIFNKMGLSYLENGTIVNTNLLEPKSTYNGNLYTDQQNNLWAINSNELTKIANGQIEATFTTENSGLTNGNINNLAQDRTGNLWVGTTFGLSLYSTLGFNQEMHQVTSINEHFTKEDKTTTNIPITLYPNPTNPDTYLYIKVEKPEYQLQAIELVNLQGRNRKMKPLESTYCEDTMINLTTVREGNYILRILIDGQWFAKRLLIKR